MRFHMTDSEIISSYKNAENYKDQVKILAELNSVPVQEMAKKMRDLGLDVDMRWYAQSQRTATKPEKEEKVYMNVNEEMQKLKDDSERLKTELETQTEINRGLTETLAAFREKAAWADKYRKIIMILMEVEA